MKELSQRIPMGIIVDNHILIDVSARTGDQFGSGAMLMWTKQMACVPTAMVRMGMLFQL